MFSKSTKFTQKCKIFMIHILWEKYFDAVENQIFSQFFWIIVLIDQICNCGPSAIKPTKKVLEWMIRQILRLFLD